jgi:hypothetical protein
MLSERLLTPPPSTQLVPEGWHLYLTHERTRDFGFKWFAQFSETAEAPSKAATPALALVAASLRARSSKIGGGNA